MKKAIFFKKMHFLGRKRHFFKKFILSKYDDLLLSNPKLVFLTEFNLVIRDDCLYLSAKYLVFNQHQKKSHRAHAHKLLDCSHIHQQHSTASTAQPARISSELSARRRWQSKESTSAMISEESYNLCDDLTIVWLGSSSGWKCPLALTLLRHY